MGRLIVEVLPSHGKRIEQRLVFDKGHATIGRSYSNDVIVDDLYVSPQHVLVSRNGTQVFVRDLGSDNGTQLPQGTLLRKQLSKVDSGQEISLGKTRLRLILPEHPVGPARPMDRWMGLCRRMERKDVATLFTLVVMIFAMGLEYLKTPGTKFFSSKLLLNVVGYMMSMAVYVGITGFFSYLQVHKAFFLRQLAFVNAGVLVYLVYSLMEPFVLFPITHQGWTLSVQYGTYFALLTVWFLFGMRFIHDGLKKKDWVRSLVGAFAIMLLFGGLSGDFRFKFKSAPAFSDSLAPHMAPLSQPQTLDTFLKEAGKTIYRFEPPDQTKTIS